MSQQPHHRRWKESVSGIQEVAFTDTDEVNANVHADDQSFDSLVILEFSVRVPPPAIQWVVDKVKMVKAKGGSELLVCPIKDETHEIVKVHISATVDRLLESAEQMEMKKVYHDGTLRELCLDDIANYRDSGDLSTFLTVAEKQRIVYHELESVRALPNDFRVPSMPKVRLYSGEAIIPRCIREGIIVDCMALHSKRELTPLSTMWYKSILRLQPLNEIREYFGETIAMYFAFLGYYTFFLVPPALLGLIANFYVSAERSELSVIMFCVFNLVWATIFLESWKRKTAELAYRWGTINTEHFEEPRAAFYGDIGKDPVTGRLQPQYSSFRRLLKFYTVSVPVMLIALVIAWFVMLAYFRLDEILKPMYAKSTSIYGTCLRLLPTVFYAVVVLILNAIYQPLAVRLNNWENHRLQSAYENNLVTKLIVVIGGCASIHQTDMADGPCSRRPLITNNLEDLWFRSLLDIFNFANCFMSLFYVAFYLQDMELLRSFLATLLITMQLVQQVQESLLPYLAYKWRRISINRHYFALNTGTDQSCVSHQTLLRGEVEKAKEDYAGTLDDYLELFLQFGYVFFFSAVYPMAAFWALVNNLIEIRTDAFKLCRTFRRPFAQPCSSIGVWEVAFELMGVIAVITNCSLVALSPSVKLYKHSYTDVQFTLLFVGAEHAILFLKVMISYLIPDKPEWVETAVASVEYQSKVAYKRQRCRTPPSSASPSATRKTIR